jgi:hypothetical protein
VQFDPRTVARDIPGVLDEVLPQLTPAIVAHFNSSARVFPVAALSEELLAGSTMQRAMLFELGCVVGEWLLQRSDGIDWPGCFAEANRRQRLYFDSRVTGQLKEGDRVLAEVVGTNLANALKEMSADSGQSIAIRPQIAGLEWIASGHGDFALGSKLIEVKCTTRRFSSPDYRQVAIYWLLSYAASIEGRGKEWRDLVLFNPRSGETVSMDFDTFLSITSGGRTKVELLQLFKTLVGSRQVR